MNGSQETRVMTQWPAQSVRGMIGRRLIQMDHELEMEEPLSVYEMLKEYKKEESEGDE